MRIPFLFAALCLLMAWLLPSHFMPWVTAYQELLTGMALCLTLLTISLVPDRNRIPAFAVLCLALATVPFIQLSTGLISYSGDAWLSSIYICAFALALSAGFNLQRYSQPALGIDFASGFAWLLLVGALVSVALAFSQWLGYGDLYWVFALPEGARPSANLAQPNNFATLAGMGLAGVIYLFESRRLPRTVAIVAALVLLFGLALSQSRSPWLTSIFVLLFWAWQRRTLSLRLANRHMLVWFSIYVVMIFSLPVLAELLGAGSSSPLERAQQMNRLGLYKQFSSAVLQGPWYGYGWGQGFTAQAQAALSAWHHEPSYYAHNILLDLLVWNGPVLGAALIVAAAGWLWLLLQRANSLPATFAWLALSFFIIHSMLEYPHAYLFFLIPAAILLGILQASVTGQPRTFPLPRWLVGVSGLVVAVLVVVMWRDYSLVEVEHQKAVTEKHETLVPVSEQAVGQVYLLTQMREYVYFIRLPLNEEYSDAQLVELKKAVNRYPRLFFLLKGAYILALNDHVDEAQDYLLKIRGLHGPERFEQILAYFQEASAEQPELLALVEFLESLESATGSDSGSS